MKFLKYLLFSLSFSGGVKASAPVIPSFVNNLEIIANTPEEFIQKMRVQEELWLSGAHESPSIEFLKNCAIYQGNLVKQALLILMADVEDSLAYWREEKKRYAIFYHICKSPSKWQMVKAKKRNYKNILQV